MKKIAFLLSLLTIVIFSVQNVLAEENKYLFPEEEVLEDLTSEEAEKILTITDMNSAIESCINERNETSYICNLYFKKSLYPNSDELATVEMLLNNLINYFSGRIISNKDGEFVYFGENSIWMTSDEWESIVSNLDKNITYGDVYVFIKRTGNLFNFMKEYRMPREFEDYCEIINNLFPFFSNLINEDINATEEWFDLMQDKKGNTISWRSDAASNIIHEIQHEISAKKSGVFTKKGINSDGKYSVSWSKLPETFWYYNPLREEWVNIKTDGTLPDSKGMGQFLTKEIKNIGLYQNYINKNTSVSNSYAVYGILSELISYSLELRFYAISYNYGYGDKYVSSHYKETCDFMINCVLQYFQFLKETQPYMYKKLIKDAELKNLILDIICYIEESYGMVTEFMYPSEDFAEIENWKKELLKHYLENEDYFIGTLTIPNLFKNIKKISAKA